MTGIETNKNKFKKANSSNLNFSPGRLGNCGVKSRKELVKLHIDKILHQRKTRNGVVEYFCTYKDLSRIHAEWLTEEKICALGPKAKNKLSVFKLQVDFYWSAGDPLFDQDYEPERILAGRPGPAFNKGDDRYEYLVKWSNLPYSQCTWDFEEDIQNDDILNKYSVVNNIERKKILTKNGKDTYSDLTHIKNKNYKNDNVLHEWQVTGVRWLIKNWSRKRGCILADEMGLGKTIQVIAFIEYLAETVSKGPFLIVCPLSTLGNWKKEFEKWSDLNVVIYQGNKKDRSVISHYEWYFWNEKGIPMESLFKFDVIVCTYESVLCDERLANCSWQLIVADEGQRLKNRDAKLTKSLKTFHSEMRIILTGTPVQNNISELWTLFNFVAPGEFENLELFKESFRDEVQSGELFSSECREIVRRKVEKSILRRLKSQVAKNIPLKSETIIEVELTKLQRQFYKRVLEQNRETLLSQSPQNNLPRLVNVIMQLRKVCNHPYLIENAYYEITNQTNTEEELFEKLVSSSGKFVLLEKLLPRLLINGSRVLIFSQMKSLLDLIEIFLNHKKMQFERIDGSVHGIHRQNAIDRFQKSEDSFVFLLTTRAGGFGINLSRADTVIIFDSDWNPQNDLQAQSRCHRIGQVKKVNVYRLITAKTYEKEMFIKASKKLLLDDSILKTVGNKSEDKSKDMSYLASNVRSEEIEDSIRYGAAEIFNEDANAEPDFVDEDIEEILENRTITFNQSASKLHEINLLMTSEVSVDKDITAKDFWTKVMPEEITLESTINECEKIKSFDSVAERRKFFLRVKNIFHDHHIECNNAGPKLDLEQRSTSLSFLLESVSSKESCFDLNQRGLCRLWTQDLQNSKRRRSTYNSVHYRKYSPGDKNIYGGNQFTEKQRKILIRLAINCLTTSFYSFWESFENKVESYFKPVFSSSRSNAETNGFCFVFLKSCSVSGDKRFSSSKVFQSVLTHLEVAFDSFVSKKAQEKHSGDPSVETLLIEDPISCDIDSFPDFRDPSFRSQIEKQAQNLSRAVDVAIRLQVSVNAMTESNKNLSHPHEKTNLPKDLLDNIGVPVLWWKPCDDNSLVQGVLKYGVENIDHVKNDQSLFDMRAKFVLLLTGDKSQQSIESFKENEISSNLKNCACSTPQTAHDSTFINCMKCKRFYHGKCFKFFIAENKAICSNCELPWPPKRILMNYLEKISLKLESFVRTTKIGMESSSEKKSNDKKAKELLKKRFIVTLQNNLLCFGYNETNNYSSMLPGYSEKKTKTKVENFLKYCLYAMLREEHQHERALLSSRDSRSLNILKIRKRYYGYTTREFKNICLCKKFSGKESLMFCSVCQKWFHLGCVGKEVENGTENTKNMQIISNSGCKSCSSLDEKRREIRKKRKSFKKQKFFEIFIEGYLPGLRAQCKSPMSKNSDLEEVCKLILADCKLQMPPDLMKSALIQGRHLTNGMCFEAVSANIDSGAYPSPNYFAEDIRQVYKTLWVSSMHDPEAQGEIEKLKSRFEELFDKTIPAHQAGSESAIEEDTIEYIEEPTIPKKLFSNVSLESACKVIERIELFRKIKFALGFSRPTLCSLISHLAVRPQEASWLANQQSDPNFNFETKMPLWWDPPVHDLLVLEEVGLRGVGSVEVILSDPAFKIALASFEGLIDEIKCRFFLEYLTDRFVLIRRLTYVTEVILKDEYFPAPIPVVFLNQPHLMKSIDSFYKTTSFVATRVSKPGPLATVAEAASKRKAQSESVLDGDENSASTKRPRSATNNDRNRTGNKNGRLEPCTLPLTLRNGTTVASLGSIVTDERRKNFHNKNHIYPVGFSSSREFPDVENPLSGSCVYVSEILDNGTEFPVFSVRKEANPKIQIYAATATGVWQKLLGKIKEKHRGYSGPKVKGNEFFGYSDKRIKKMIEKLPGAHVCTKYGN